MLVQREWLAKPVDWTETSPPSGVSREDFAVLLARGTPRRFRTLQSGVARLPPGYELVSTADAVRTPVRRWSALRSGAAYLGCGLDEMAAELRVRLQQSVRRHSEGKRVGLLLSGGYDSALLATLMARDGVDLKCYSVDAPELFPSEWEHARETASRLKVSLQKITVTLDDLLKAPAAMRLFKSTPNMCLTTAYLLAASRAAADDLCDIVMLGTGSDELLGPCTQEADAVKRFRQRAGSIGTAETWSTLLGDQSPRRTEVLYRGNIAPFPEQTIQQLFPDLELASLVEEDIAGLYRDLHAEDPQLPYESLTLQLELELRSSDVLMHELAAAASVHGMPTAFPFYDRSIVELAAGMPLTFKTCTHSQDGASPIIHKYLLRHAFRDCMPVAEGRPRSVATLPFQWDRKSDVKQELLQTIEDSPVWGQLGVSHAALIALVRDGGSEGEFWRVPRRFWLLYQLTQLEDVSPMLGGSSN